MNAFLLCQRWLTAAVVAQGHARAASHSEPDTGIATDLEGTAVETWTTGVRWGPDQGRVPSYHLLPPSPVKSVLASLRQGWNLFSAKGHLDTTPFMRHTKLAT